MGKKGSGKVGGKGLGGHLLIIEQFSVYWSSTKTLLYLSWLL